MTVAINHYLAILPFSKLLDTIPLQATILQTAVNLYILQDPGTTGRQGGPPLKVKAAQPPSPDGRGLKLKSMKTDGNQKQNPPYASVCIHMLHATTHKHMHQSKPKSTRFNAPYDDTENMQIAKIYTRTLCENRGGNLTRHSNLSQISCTVKQNAPRKISGKCGRLYIDYN